MQEGSDVLLRSRAAKSRQDDPRGGGGASEEAHRHLRGSSLEERCQRQRHHPAMCGRFLSWLLRLKKNSSALRLSIFKRQDFSLNIIYDHMKCCPEIL